MSFRTAVRARASCPHSPRAQLHRGLIVAAAVAALAGAAPAWAAPYNPDELQPAQLSAIHRLCRGVMGLARDERRFFICVSSLSNSARGFGGATPPLSLTTVAGPEPGSRKAYPYASRREIYQREQLSCSRLGMAPGSDAFVSCTANLDAALEKADKPTQ
jgi:hypothetical protein